MSGFQVGDMAVYQGQGTGQITEIAMMDVAGSTLEVYTLKLPDGTIVRVPTAKASQRLREVIDANEVPEVYQILRQEADGPKDKTWNRRYRAYNDKLRTGSVREIAQVLRDLYRLKGDKELSYGEKQMLDQARTLLVHELSLATKRDEVEVAQELDELFVGEC